MLKASQLSPSQWATEALSHHGYDVTFHDEIESTNTFAKNLALHDSPFKIYLADYQTQGRGRGQHTWTTAPQEALLGTWSIALKNPPGHLMAPLIGLDLHSAVAEVWTELTPELSIKPPNDLFLGLGKVAGLLVEAVSAGPVTRLLIGLGFNVLGHPTQEPAATHLTSHLLGDLKAEHFQDFIVRLTARWARRAEATPVEVLNETDRASLEVAIKRHSKAGLGLVRLHSNGDLEYTDRKVSWLDL